MTKYSYGRQLIEDDDIEAVVRTLRSDYLTTGPAVSEFEEALRQELDAQHVQVVSSGTAALHLSALALGLGPGDQVIVPSITFLATANAVRFVGAEVVFADVNADSGLMELEHFEAALGVAPRAEAVIPVHLAGALCSMEGLREVATARGLSVVEDACHALGGAYDLEGREKVGNCRYSDVTSFSFHPVKTIAMGEGGAIATNSDEIAQYVEDCRNHGIVRNADRFVQSDLAQNHPWYHEMQLLGWNYRASDIHCALGHSQLKKLPRFVEKRKRLAAVYDKVLKELAPVVRRPAYSQTGQFAWHLLCVLIDFDAVGKSRSQVMDELATLGIGTQVHYIPVHTQPYYTQLVGALQLPGAEKYYDSCLSLPLYPSLDEADIEEIVHNLKKVLGMG